MATHAPIASTPADLVELAAEHDLALRAETVQLNDAGLDYRVAFAHDADGDEWVLRIPRRPDVSAKLDEERRILAFVAPRLSVAVPNWQRGTDRLIAYRKLPGSPGLTLDAAGQPVWHVDPSSPELARSLGQLIAQLQALPTADATTAGVPTQSPSDVRAQWRTHLEQVRAEFPISSTLDGRWEAWLANDALWPTFTTLTHGELYAAHLLLDPAAQIVGVLDWTTAKISDPAIDFTYQHMMGPAAFDATYHAYRAAGGPDHPHLADRCAEIAAAAPLVYAIFALHTRDPEHRATATAQLTA